MTRLIITALFCIGCLFAVAQPLVVNFSGAADQAPGSEVTIDVSVEDFDNLVLFQFGILWDPNVATFNSITNVTTELAQFTEEGNIGTPENASQTLDDGEIFTSWSLASTEPFSIPDGTVLFSIVLDMVGEPCDTTTLNIGDLPPDRLIEVVDQSFNLVGAVSDGTEVSVDGDNCDGGNSDVLCLSGSTEFVEQGDKSCVEVSVKNFISIETAQSGISWDPTKLEYCGVDSFGLPGLSANLFNTTNVESGELKFLWFDNTGANPVTLPNDSIIFRVCFNAIGEIGDCVPVDFVDLPQPPPLFIEFSSGGSPVDFEVNSGKINITDENIEPLIINGATVGEVCPGDAICVPFTADGFNDIGSAQFTMIWDTDFMTYTGQDNLNTDLPITNFNFNGVEDVPGEGITKVRFSWNASSTCMIPDGSLLYEMCFTVNDEATGSTNIQMVSDPPVNIEFGNCSGQALNENEYQLNSATVNLAPPSQCMMGEVSCSVNVTNVCFGETSTGAASVGMTEGLTPPFNLEWKNNLGTVISTAPQLTGQGPGTYTMCITDSQDVSCTQEFTILENPEILINVIPTNATCGENGSAEIEVTGGMGDLIVTLVPDADITDLPAGSYTVNVTDAANCTASSQFDILEAMPDEISVTVDLVDGCDGEEGMVDIAVDGGCDPTCTVNGTPCEDIMMLPAGNYVAIVTEGTETVEQPFTVNTFMFSIMSNVIGPENGLGAMDGFVNIIVESTCTSPTFSWSGPNGYTAQTMNIAGLSSGSYTVTVTCGNGCSQSMVFVVPNVNDPCSSFSSLTVTDVSCAGSTGADCDGTITGVVTANCIDPTYSVNGSPQTDELNAQGLCAGEYNIQVFDGGVFAFATTVEVGQGDPLTSNPIVTDATEAENDGAINLNISGGTAPYTVEWNRAGVEGENPTGLQMGLYNAIVTDANGCDIIVQNIRVNGPDIPEPCFTALNIITPNADGANDVFIINCAPATNNRLQIFDRWGRLVYGTVNYGNDWQGVDDDGDLLEEGAYMWVIEVELGIGDTRIFRGTLTVLREL